MIPANKKNPVFIKPAFITLIINFLLLIFLTSVSAQTDEIEKRTSQEANSSQARRKSIGRVQLVSFNLTGGQRVSGKLVNEDAFKIEIAEIKGSKIILSTYSKNDIDKKSVIYKNISELDYWRDTGKYFLQKVWDFQDDPDEFIQAIRCFESAKSVVMEAFGPEHKLVAELDEKISQIKADMEKWAQQVKSRQELRNMEVLSTLDVQLQKIKEQLNANSENIAAVRRELAASAGDYNELRNKITNDELALKLLQQQMFRFESELDDLWRWYRYQPRYYVQPRGPREPNSGSMP